MTLFVFKNFALTCPTDFVSNLTNEFLLGGVLRVLLFLRRSEITHELQQQDCQVSETNAGVKKFIFLSALSWVSVEESVHDLNISFFVKIHQNKLFLPFRAFSNPIKWCQVIP